MALIVVEFFIEFDDGEFLLLADVQLVDQFIVDVHELLLENGDFLLVLAALPPGRLLRVYHNYNCYVILDYTHLRCKQTTAKAKKVLPLKSQLLPNSSSFPSPLPLLHPNPLTSHPVYLTLLFELMPVKLPGCSLF
jgi:hypothetical protein